MKRNEPLLRTAVIFVTALTAWLPASAVAAPPITVKIHELRNFSSKNRAKLDEILGVFETVVNSEEFREKVLNFETCLKVKKGVCVSSERSFYFRKSDVRMTNEEVLEKIFEGTESYAKEPRYNPLPGNGIADLFLKSYWSRKKVIGYTYAGRRTVYLNSRYFPRQSTGYLAGNLVHEWMHKLGFKHSSNSTRLRGYSVPYAVGNIVRQIATGLTRDPSDTEVRSAVE